jgi:radical SAM family uncharacterized protein
LVLSQNEIKEKLDRYLLKVQKPGRYTGGELNQIVKEWESVNTHVALVFPDIYDLGISNLGLAILYETLNQRDDVLAERAYCPWDDMEALMREENIPLYSLESKRALSQFDIIGISLPYETLYTNALNLLDLAQVPLHAHDRSEKHPLIIAGGHTTFNPEPMSDFIDVFVIGDGEEVIHEIVDTYQKWKQAKSLRRDLFKRLAGIGGVYIPSLYNVEYQADGTIRRVIKNDDRAPAKILKHIVADLSHPPTHPIVPSIGAVHNRISVEIMRGCSRGCRFCHAGMINRPVRERPVEEIIEIIQESLDNTGFEEVALLSLSSSDYTNILPLVDALQTRFEGQNLKISLPSLRIESFSIDLLEKLRTSRPGGFTLAPEAASDRMRHIINKPIPEDQIIQTTREIYQRGWLTIKLYFMIGHPSETLEDVRAIADLCKKILAEGHKSVGRKAKLHVGVSTFVPKAHTPFQWASCDEVEQIEAKQALLMDELRGPGFKLNWTDPWDTLLEALLSRGDRRLGKVIHLAWKNGAKFDAWQDKSNRRAWEDAMTEARIDPSFYTHRQREKEEIFPWDHISSGVNKSFIAKEYQLSLEGVSREDCRNQCYGCGILTNFSEIRKENTDAAWKCPQIPVREQP